MTRSWTVASLVGVAGVLTGMEYVSTFWAWLIAAAAIVFVLVVVLKLPEQERSNTALIPDMTFMQFVAVFLVPVLVKHLLGVWPAVILTLVAAAVVGFWPAKKHS